MTWTKQGDEFADECWELSDAAYRLHDEGLIWSNRKALDGKLAKEDMVRWAKRPAAAEELVACGWWEDHGGHYQIIHHLGYQRTKEQIAHQSNVNRANRAKGKVRPVKNKPSNDSSNDSSDEVARTGQARPGQENRHLRKKTARSRGRRQTIPGAPRRSGSTWSSGPTVSCGRPTTNERPLHLPSRRPAMQDMPRHPRADRHREPRLPHLRRAMRSRPARHAWAFCAFRLPVRPRTRAV